MSSWATGTALGTAALHAATDFDAAGVATAAVAAQHTADNATYAPVAKVTAPASPVVNQMWNSSSLMDLHISPGVASRIPILQPSQAWEQGSVQEPLVWYYGGKWRMLYTGGWFAPGLGYAECSSDPLIAANWTKPLSATLLAGAVHGGLYIEGSTGYYYSQISGTGALKCYTFPLFTSGTPALTLAGSVLTQPASTGTIMANPFVVKDATQANLYTLFFEGNPSGDQIGCAGGATPTSTFTGINATTSSLMPSGCLSTSNPYIVLEGGTYVCYFHAGGFPGNSALPTQIYRASCPQASLAANIWVIDKAGRPVIRRAAPAEVDQVADVCLAQEQSGAPTWLAWTAVDNTAPAAQIMATSAVPLIRAWDGTEWVKQDITVDATPRVTDPQKSVVATLAADYSVTGTPTTAALSAFFSPSGTQAVVDFMGTGSDGNASAGIYQQIVVGATTYNVGLLVSSAAAGAQFMFGGKVLLTGLTPGTPITVTLKLGTSSGTFQCRPVGNPTIEYCALEVRDAAKYPNPN